jgi:hypothetical protein
MITELTNNEIAPGVTLDLSGREMRALIKRCECGRPISNNKAACLKCHQALLQRAGEAIGENRELYQQMLDRAESPETRRTLEEQLKPYLRF